MMNGETLAALHELSEADRIARARSGDNWTVTASGKRMYALEPRPEDIDIEDIAHALSNICRWNGHTREFYSVAQHSVLVSHHAYTLSYGQASVGMWGLLHDAPEAYMCDLPRPIKRAPGLAGYMVAEDRLMDCIAERFGLVSPTMPAEVKQADDAVLLAEARDFLPTFDLAMMPQVEAWPATPIWPWSSKIAREMFLARFAAMTIPNSVGA